MGEHVYLVNYLNLRPSSYVTHLSSIISHYPLVRQLLNLPNHVNLTQKFLNEEVGFILREGDIKGGSPRMVPRDAFSMARRSKLSSPSKRSNSAPYARTGLKRLRIRTLTLLHVAELLCNSFRVKTALSHAYHIQGENQLNIFSSPTWGIQMDESTDKAGHAQAIIYARFVDI